VDIKYNDMESEFIRIYDKCRTETMTSIERMYALWQTCHHIVQNKVEGDVVECGVWRGGSMMMAAMTLADMGDVSRMMWLYDTFSGMPAPGEYDIKADTGCLASKLMSDTDRTPESWLWAIAQKEIVASNMAVTSYPADKIRMIEGQVEHTIPLYAPEKIALLRLDTDWHDSTHHELAHLWPKLQSGGILIIDDYGYWRGSRLAVDNFFKTLPYPPMLTRLDDTGRICVKH
jgi:O-methyltransferase